MAEYTHSPSGVRVSVADDKVLGAGFVPVEKPKSAPKKSDEK